MIGIQFLDANKNFLTLVCLYYSKLRNVILMNFSTKKYSVTKISSFKGYVIAIAKMCSLVAFKKLYHSHTVESSSNKLNLIN